MIKSNHQSEGFEASFEHNIYPKILFDFAEMSKFCEAINFPQKDDLWNFSNVAPRIFKQRVL